MNVNVNEHVDVDVRKRVSVSAINALNEANNSTISSELNKHERTRSSETGDCGHQPLAKLKENVSHSLQPPALATRMNSHSTFSTFCELGR